MKLKTILLTIFVFLIVNTTFSKEKKKITISGYITDTNEQPLEGVTIIINNSDPKTFSNKKGFYKIKVKPVIKTVTAYSISHGGIEMEFNGKTRINFILSSDSLSPQYISIGKGKMYDSGYGMISKRNATTSMSKIEKGNTKISFANIYEMIQARASGVTVRNKSITIRGLSSFNNQGEPLFVVDGSITSSIDYINPNDVDSITILKGASASIYGTRGAFGVIVITLKHGEDIK